MKIIFFYSVCILVGARAILNTEQDDATSLTSCVVDMIEDIDYHLMDITVMNMNNDLKLSALHNVKGVRFVSRRFFWDSGNISNVIYIVMSKDYQELEQGLSKVISDKFWNPSARFIIVLQKFGNYSLYDITNLLHVYNIFYNVSLISRHGDDYAIYKYNFTKPGYCFQSGHLTFWSRCSDYHIEKNLPVLFNGSIRGCRYKFITRNMWPFTNFDTSNLGTDQYFLTLFMKQFEVKIDLYEFDKVDKYGKLMNNVSLIMIQKVVNNEFEGAVGGYAINQENICGNVSYSYPIVIDHLLYVVPHSDYVREQWIAVLYQSFQMCFVMFLLFIIFCMAAIFLSIFQTRKDVSYNILIVFGYLLNKNSVKRTETGWPQTLIFSCLLFTAFIIPYAIQANLCSVTTQPIRGFEPKEPEDLGNYHPILYSEWQYRHEFPGHWVCGTRLNCLMDVKNCPHKYLYSVIADAHFKVYQWQLTDDLCQMVLYPLKESYLSIYRTILLRRGSVLIPHLNKFTLQLFTTGLTDKFFGDIYHREWLQCKPHHRPEHMALNLSNFYSVFSILIGGYCLSILIFIYEVWFGSQHNVRLNVN